MDTKTQAGLFLADPATPQAGMGAQTPTAQAHGQASTVYHTQGALPVGGAQSVAAATPEPRPVAAAEPQKLLDRWARLHPPVFGGKRHKDPHDFIDQCRDRLHNMRILESHGVNFATFQLEGRARRWWKSYLFGRPADSPPMTWDRFTCIFLDRYIPLSQRKELRFQFEQLQLGQMSVTDYEARFSELSRLALMILPTDAKRVRRFVAGSTNGREGLFGLSSLCSGHYCRDSVIDSVPVVSEFSDIFPSDLPCMPPDRDIDFCIDMAPDTQPLSIPPYCIAPKELKELKEQLDELLSKGFVRPKRDLNLRQRRWLELLKDYDITILYYPDKANVVADAFSRKAESMGSLAFISAEERPLALDIQALAIRLDRLYVPKVDGLKEKILEEALSSRYSFHPGATKMYRDPRKHYWWHRMKKDIIEYVATCLNYQQVKYEHQRPGGLL
ncbi:uncharacterized protein [Nicotiana tomentosiformis]|uniref:uncharacterized protein n=1 Tax=Nicotiana tomentosiformis TaxID=4098 RepID=UPI00388CE1AE